MGFRVLSRKQTKLIWIVVFASLAILARVTGALNPIHEYFHWHEADRQGIPTSNLTWSSIQIHTEELNTEVIVAGYLGEISLWCVLAIVGAAMANLTPFSGAFGLVYAWASFVMGFHSQDFLGIPSDYFHAGQSVDGYMKAVTESERLLRVFSDRALPLLIGVTVILFGIYFVKYGRVRSRTATTS